MKFIDEVEIEAIAGDGGDGCLAFRREKFVPRGGPSGGDGGRGGHVWLRSDRGLSTLLDLKYRPLLRAGRGEHGRGKDQYGRAGADLLIDVPVGTIVLDAENGDQIADLREHAAQVIVAHGGRGGLGNIHFATPTRRAPRIATPGEPGEHRSLRLELRLLADVGVLGFPNVGKSSLVAALSAARPKIADYPFTTLVPQLGVVRIDEGASFVMADIPGLIPGAHRGSGLGTRFLRHLSRTAVLVHVLDFAAASQFAGAHRQDEVSDQPQRNPLDDFDTINHELSAADPELAAKPQIVVVNKLDLAEARERFPAAQAAFRARGIELLGISAAARQGLNELVTTIARTLTATRASAHTTILGGTHSGASHPALPCEDETADSRDPTDP